MTRLVNEHELDFFGLEPAVIDVGHHARKRWLLGRAPADTVGM